MLLAKQQFTGKGALCVKMDIEGAELDILEHFQDAAVHKIVWEHHFGVDPSLVRLRSICNRLEQQGFLVRPYHKIPKGNLWTGFLKITEQIYAERNL
jgi:hypothetical protein